MPLRIAEEPINPGLLKEFDEQFLIFYSSVVDGKMWCPDCRDVERSVQKTFELPGAPKAVIVYVGTREQWKLPAKNPFREEPWEVTGVPTIIKVKDHVAVERLVEDEITNSRLSEFIKG